MTQTIKAQDVTTGMIIDIHWDDTTERVAVEQIATIPGMVQIADHLGWRAIDPDQDVTIVGHFNL